MKKLISFMLAIVLCVALACPAFAADGFVPSISYKIGPRLISAVGAGGEDAMGCIVITTLAEAKNPDIHVEEVIREALLETHEGIVEDTLELPYDTNKFVVRELLDIRYNEEACEAAGHEHFPLTLTFEMGVDKDALVEVYTCVDDKVEPIKSVENNGDGTVTCVFEKLCPVLFVVNRTDANGSPNTGDNSAIGLYVALMALSLCAGAVLLTYRKKV